MLRVVKAYGLDVGFRDEDTTLRELGEVTIVFSDADELRRVASFVQNALALVEKPARISDTSTIATCSGIHGPRRLNLT